MIHPDTDARRMLVRERHAVLARDAAQPGPARPETRSARVSLRRSPKLPTWFVGLRPAGRRP